MQPATWQAAAPFEWRRAAAGASASAAATTVVADSAESLAGLPVARSRWADEGQAALLMYIGSLGRELGAKARAKTCCSLRSTRWSLDGGKSTGKGAI